ncbi:MAG TPA: amidohydrolase [Anaerolineales bacterium]|nr:amidohydrolase [Anaerolineales bacterium]
MDLFSEAQELFEYSQALRRDFHRNPELGFQEVRTAGIVARELNGLGLEVSTGVGKTGVMALMEGARPGPVVLLRFDMDALPILEETGAEYASQNPGVMHACGHDGHTAIGLTVARLLEKHREELPGTLKFMFQPAEEGLGGAEAMIADGLLETPRPDLALSLHLWNEKPLGWIGVTPGPAMSASERFRVQIIGRGGHAAAPHLTADPVVAAAQVIGALQGIVARNVAPLKSAVISVTSVQGGEAFNVIPSTVELRGTIRSYEADVRSLLLERLNEVVTGVSAAMGCRAEIETWRVTPAVINDRQLTRRVQQVAGQLFPGDELDENERTMGSEDMAYVMEQIPGCYFFIGSANQEKGLNAAHHHPRFDFDEAALPKAAALMAAAAVELLNNPHP